MNILHISDLHFRGKGDTYGSQADLLKTIPTIIGNRQIDACIFCGDLVDKFNAKFIDAYDLLHKLLLKPLNCTSFYITCGNHDADRKLIRPMFKTYLAHELTTIVKLNAFVDNDVAGEFTDSCRHVLPFLAFQKTLYAGSANDIVEPLYSLHKRQIGNTLVAFASINLAWSVCDDNTTPNSLVFPPTILHAILKNVDDCQFKVLLTHYPLECLNDVCRSEIENIVYKDFHCLLSGHFHKESLSVQSFSDDGILKCASPASLSSLDFPNAGFLINEIDFITMSSKVEEYHFDRTSKKPFLSNTHNLNIPVSKEKRDAIKFRKAISQKYESVMEDANRLFVHSPDETKLSFLDIFSDPVIKTKGKSISTTIKDDHLSTANAVKYTDILANNNYIVYGDDKSGKTSLLYRLLLHYLNEFEALGSIPILVDLKPYYRGMVHDFDVSALVSSYYNLSRILVDTIIKTRQITLLLDNFSLSYPEINETIEKAILQIPLHKVILTSTTSLKISIHSKFGVLSLKDLYIHDITRKQVREITYKWPTVKETTRDQVVDKLTTIFTELNIHFNYWTVSLFLWIFEKTSVLNLHNNFELIELYIDNLLEKANLALNLQKSFSFDNLKDFLSDLAYSLYSNHEQGDYACSYSSLVLTFEKFKSNNVRIVADSKEIIDYIIDKSIVVPIQSDLYTFRLNGVFEYFLAYYMGRKPDFRKSIVGNPATALSFKNEIELYAGFSRHDEDLLMTVFQSCSSIANEMVKTYKLNEKEFEDIELTGGMKEYKELLYKLKDEVCPMSEEDQDKLADSVSPLSNIDSRVKPKEKHSISVVNSAIFGDYLTILGRILRNSDNIENEKTISDIFDFLVNQSCMLIMCSFQETFGQMDHEGDKNKKEFLQFIKSFTPIVIHAFLYDAVGHRNLSKLIRKKIAEAKNIKPRSEMKLFVLYFLAIEADLLGEIDLLDEIIELAAKWSTQHSILLKILMYTAFKSTGNPAVAKLLKEKGEKAFKKLYPDRPKSDIHETMRKISQS